MNIPIEKETSSGFWTGLLILVLGVALGALLTGGDRSPAVGNGEAEPGAAGATAGAEPVELEIPVAPAAVPEEPPVNDLRTIYIDLDQAASERLQAVVDRSMLARHIAQEEGDLVPAIIRGEGKTIEADLRIKGDFLDHIDTDKWSFRIELKSDKLFGMSRFSIQHPKTRSYLYEWLHMEMARREGLLAPRADFVNVVVNGNSTGIYYLEEHFTKELIESQGRREGPIVRFVEDTFLGMEAQFIATLGYASEAVIPARMVTRAQVAAYGEKRLNQSENLSRQLQQALELMRKIQEDRDGQHTHEILDIQSNATMHALAVLFRTAHGANWKSRRYYHNPVTGRLEPIIFDTGSGAPAESRDPLTIMKYVIPSYLRNAYFYQAMFREIGRVSAPEYIETCLDELRPKLINFERLLRAEGLDDPLLNAAAIEAELREQQAYLYDLVHPRMAVNFDCTLLTEDVTGVAPDGELRIEAWATTAVPVVLQGFRLENGRFLPARDLKASTWVPEVAGDPGAVTLPTDGRHVYFSASSNTREAVLKDLAELKSAIRSGAEADRSLKITVTAVHRLISEPEATQTKLPIRKFGEVWAGEGGRPAAPSLEAALAKHPYLELDPIHGRLQLVAGRHQVDGDLVVPDGYTLHAGPGVQLEFGPQNALISSAPLAFEGSSEAPITLGPLEGNDRWAGLAVLQPGGPSTWRHVHVRDTDAIRRSGWMMTGGINFYNAPVELFDCRFDNALGEDALNIFGTEFLMDGVVIDGVASDAFDGDFVTGTVVRSTFMNSVEDAVDVSGSEISVEDCRFVLIGDKAISAGENSGVRVRDCRVESASIAVASKDFSRVDLDGLVVDSAINYGFAVYIKKAEFGPSSIVAKNVTLGAMGRGDAIVQETCSLTLDGVVHAGVPLDVKALYEAKILGQ